MPGGRDIAYDPSSALIATKSFEVADRNRTGVLVHGVASQIPISQLFHKTWPSTRPVCATGFPQPEVITTTASKSQWHQGAFTTHITASQISTLTLASLLCEGEGGNGILARHVTYDCVVPMIGKLHDGEGLQLVLAGLFAWQVRVPDRCAVVGMREGTSRRMVVIARGGH